MNKDLLTIVDAYIENTQKSQKLIEELVQYTKQLQLLSIDLLAYANKDKENIINE